MPLTKKKSGTTKKLQKQKVIVPPMPKGSQLKKIVKKLHKQQLKPKKTIKRVKPKETHLKKLKKVQKTKFKRPTIPMKKETPPIKQPSNPLAWMYEDKSAQQKQLDQKKSPSKNAINQNIKELYGSDFASLTPGQQKYIIDNQEIMRRITQEVLTRVASVNLTQNLNVNRTNIIEFYLHPNGDMSDFRFIQKSGIYILDDTTKETIEYAYSRYPRPKEKTLIRYNVFYNLRRY